MSRSDAPARTQSEPGKKPARKSAKTLKTAEHVAADLRRKIQDGILSPGEWLREMPICEEYGVGRSITRSALRELAEDGLIHIEEKRGGYVAATTVQEVFDLYEARAALYGLAARFACIRSEPKFMAETLQLIDELFIDTEGGETSPEDLIHQSEAIFSRLVSVSSRDAQRMIESIRRKTRWHYSYVSVAGNAVRPLEPWRVLRAGLAARDPAMAGEGARNILYHTQNEVMRLMISRGFGLNAMEAPPLPPRKRGQRKAAGA